jgi:hypothetical protein
VCIYTEKRYQQEIASNSTAVVIQNYRKPWLGRIFTMPLHQDIKEGVIRLPNRILSLCLPAVNQVESGAVGLLSLWHAPLPPRHGAGCRNQRSIPGFNHRRVVLVAKN